MEEWLNERVLRAAVTARVGIRSPSTSSPASFLGSASSDGMSVAANGVRRILTCSSMKVRTSSILVGHPQTTPLGHL